MAKALKRHIDPWMQTFCGLRFNPIKAKPGDVRIEDIAHALSLYPRFGGHTKHHYSIAQHVCLCHDHVIEELNNRHNVLSVTPQEIRLIQLQALLHDSTEAYMGDIVKPLKCLLPDYQRIKEGLNKVIMKRYGLPDTMYPEVKTVDMKALATEKRDLLTDGPIWESLKGIKPWKTRIVPWSCSVAEEQLLFRYNDLRYTI